MSKTRIKMCGFTRSSDITNAVQAGADAIGLVFYPPSKRAVNAAQAAVLVKQIPPFVSTVGLFVNQTSEVVNKILSQVPLSLLQFHGDESAAYCESFERPYIKAIRLPIENTDQRAHELAQQHICQQMSQHSNASGFLLDAALTGMPGGTGQCFDWSMVPAGLERPIILAGGLNSSNVAEAISQLELYAVDVSSGIESSPGHKEADLIAAFVTNVAAASKYKTSKPVR